MVAFFDCIPPDLRDWLLRQPVFFVASAPSTGAHINLSPKGLPAASLAVLSPTRVAYLDATGSGNESISHLRENGRMTLMFCSFNASPRILRLFCTGSVIEWNEPPFHPMLAQMQLADKYVESARAVMVLDVFKVQTSCGYGVPRLALTTDPTTNAPKPYLQDRETMGHWASNKIAKNELHAYQVKMNSDSLDGLPGLRAAMRERAAGNLLRTMWVDVRIWGCRNRRVIEMVGVMLMSVLMTVAVMREGFLSV
ncbi:hypothetical protein RJZ56_007457 [Blastomyces dermatitidis]|uniref:Pyridoxamine phosphate oxidase n=3 Tax=Blastomyces TaxID=229219 RepID=A0A179UDW7_BLAGS|nr:pyridoxamine phosphate oxidase [Blastomyces gilchristii SLH14081]XP_045276440.1 pyridoxamine phosphate oxidase [Blastomyces dermatitidis ER-3]EGE86911.1 pyridoxamine phosphate oxidase [Blastomyces dermatitidis ATCC 18188]EQL31651.1 hypothetical protein BDFG_06101 [Blastomyces dermatitidis ATCC 26199]EEQ89539.1 pyridoxamine phosphate oxidase [Blastomyces dermatitidis ER-3]OAT05211.1 pyridoxamine phosphate oxidase [Blastomyces gilchristii SLH14081]